VELDVTLRNAASEAQEELTLQVRGADSNNLVTHIVCSQSKVAIVRRKFDPHSALIILSPEYDVEVTKGVDMALVGLLLIAELKTLHIMFFLLIDSRNIFQSF